METRKMIKPYCLWGALVIAIITSYDAISAPQQDVPHPRIYTTDQNKEDFLKSIAATGWKHELVERKKAKLEKYIKLVQEDSSWLVSRLQMNWKTKHDEVYLRGGNFSHSAGQAPVPTVRYSGTRDWATDYRSPSLEEVQPYFDDERGMYLQRKDDQTREWVKPSETGHIIEGINDRIMALAADAAFLYWLTDEEKYAELAAPVFFQYIEGMYYRNPPVVIDESSQKGLSGLATFEVIHERIVVSLAVTYDFLYDYFQKQERNLAHTQAVFQKWGDQIITYGVPDNNWNLFQARFLTYIALVLEDDLTYENGKGRQYYLKNTFDQSSERQIALKESMLIYDQENGIWPESPSYSMHVTTTLLEILTLLDNFTHANELANFPIVEKAALAAFQYLFPNGYTVGFGDSGHKTVPPENLELLISNYRKYGQSHKEKHLAGLLSQQIEKGLYEREADNLFELFFYVDELPELSEPLTDDGLITPTFYAPNVSLFIQRQGSGNNAMMISTVGSFGNHAHANGIAMELFANNYALGPDMGRGTSYWHPDFREYYSQFPAHNTVVVDGASTYRSMRSYQPFTLEHSFPLSGSKPLFEKVSFVDVSFFEPKTRSDQQRLTALIRTPSNQSYALDIFRSGKVEGGAQQHDYFYHNIGQSLTITDWDNSPLDLKQTTELGSEHGELKAYDYFTDKKKVSTDEDLKALFTVRSENQPDQFMQLWVKGESGQQVFSVNGPESNALSRGTAPPELIGKEIPALMLRRQKSAWENPFVVLFNPYRKSDRNPIASVHFGGDALGSQRITVDLMDEQQDIITVCKSSAAIIEDEQHYQKGLLSLVRTANDTAFEFVFVAGMNVFKWNGLEIIATGQPATVSIERIGSELLIQNDQPIVLRLMKSREFEPKSLVVYDNEQASETKQGVVSRDHPEQLEFRLAQPYEKVKIVK
ncbi:hypothetical protein OKW21_004601 [Catalinimonas alkaloidigena]|uniref:heparinase II/III domain-containing protein n=1 Tax=Catalinimonas alkaloidigena TaxID=1075417 RepID=UPI002406FE4A|nr:heparinase II/III family protein [Catalinimonas alkaloidigena]MDF9799338.1 hypothetical protein [Catalinimonas alkaloidigena]